MNEIAVIGPVNGLYHLGYQASAQKFYSINEFVSREQAEVAAWRMNQNRMKGAQ